MWQRSLRQSTVNWVIRKLQPSILSQVEVHELPGDRWQTLSLICSGENGNVSIGRKPLRPTVIAGNWKMHKNQAEARAFLQAFLPLVTSSEFVHQHRQIVLCTSYTSLQAVQATLQQSQAQVALGAQNIHWEDQGAYTGEIAGDMLTELGVSHVIVGHSERRQHFGETDETVNRRLLAAQRHGLQPILCVGETKQIRDRGEAEGWILQQLRQALVGVDRTRLVIAYEPIWAIGTGDTCAAEEANRVIQLIRKNLANPEVVIQYGGSVKASNIDDLMAQPEIDGVLVGGASLDPQEFARIVNYQSLSRV
ncbi:MAG: triose-phosphate isomerase [Synechococcaceae cyanobacterium SM2_3_1]|nr:triose-phosphate isomerase [Synechococcaceae cyanobacterium SM2_3_1]